MGNGAQCVMTFGATKKHKLFADNWDSLQWVSNQEAHSVDTLAVSLAAIAHSSSEFGQGIGSIHLDNVQCVGSETSLLACSYSDTHNCIHFEDAGVECRGVGSQF